MLRKPGTVLVNSPGAVGFTGASTGANNLANPIWFHGADYLQIPGIVLVGMRLGRHGNCSARLMNSLTAWHLAVTWECAQRSKMRFDGRLVLKSPIKIAHGH